MIPTLISKSLYIPLKIMSNFLKPLFWRLKKILFGFSMLLISVSFRNENIK